MSITLWLPKIGDAVMTPDGPGEIIGRADYDRQLTEDRDYIWGADRQRVPGPHVTRLCTGLISAYRLDDLSPLGQQSGAGRA